MTAQATLDPIAKLGVHLRGLIWHALDARAIRAARKAGIDKRRIAVVCGRGHGYGGNPAYIVEALEQLFPRYYDIVLLSFERPSNLPAYVRFVAADSRDALCELARARLWIADVRTDWPIDKTPEQIYLQAWHGSLGPKKIERAAEDKLNPGYAAICKRDGHMTSFMCANNALYERVFKEDFWQTGPVVRCGAPRNKPLVHYDAKAAESLRKSLGISPDQGLLLYAPTFRNAQDLQVHALDLNACTAALKKRFGRPFATAYRLHPEVAQAEKPSFLEGCIDVTSYPDAQKLLCAVDVLISDYSSILEDFLLLARPCFTFAPDLREYEAERGLYYPLQKRPAPFAQTQEGLLAAIGAYDHDDFLAKRDAFFTEFDLVDDGNGAETIARIIHAAMPN